MKFEIENCSENIERLRNIEGIIEVKEYYNPKYASNPYIQSHFYKEFDTLEELMEFSKNQGHDLIIGTGYSEGIVDEQIDGTIKIYDYWNE